MMVMAVIVEGLLVGGHRLSLPPSSVRFGPHGSDKLPSKWEKLPQEPGPGAGEQLGERAKGSEQSLAFLGTAPLSMVLTAGRDHAVRSPELRDFSGATRLRRFLSPRPRLLLVLAETNPGGARGERQADGEELSI